MYDPLPVLEEAVYADSEWWLDTVGKLEYRKQRL